MVQDKRITVAILGNPNTGSTSIFNHLTGLNASVGNYPRVTVGIRKHTFEYQGWEIELIDLPGIYSLSCRTDEERESRNFLYHQAPDLILNVVDMSNLERNLLLTSQLIEMSIPRITALNMVDEASEKGIQLEIDSFEALLSTSVIQTNGRDGKGVDELLNAIKAFAENDLPISTIKLNYDSHLEAAIERTQVHIAELHDGEMLPEHSRWLAIKLLENDSTVIEEEGDHTDLIAAVAEEREELFKGHSENAETLLNNGRFGFVNGLLQETLQMDMDTVVNRIDATRVIDAFLLHKWFGIPIFLFIMWVMFESTFTLGAYPTDWIDASVGLFSEVLNNNMPDSLFKDLLINGIIAGVGGTIIFLPNIVILFFFIAVFNDTGYMVRGAVLVDRIMHKFGLHGKAFIPMLTGFGCNVPAIMATRTIENKRDRLVAILVNPFISCSARLPVFILFTGAFFGENAGTALFGIYMVSIFIALGAALFLSKTIVHGANTSPFLMELPPYRVPTWASISTHMKSNAAEFLKKVGGIIIAGSIAIWFLQTFPLNIELSKNYQQEISSLEAASQTETNQLLITQLQLDMDQEIQHKRYLGQIGRFIQPIFAPMNFDTNTSIALLTGVIAKEIVVATFGVLYAQGDGVDETNLSLRESIAKSMDIVTAISFMIFTLLYIPCLSTIAIIYRETESLKWTSFSVGFSLSLAYVLAALVSLVGGWFI
ncbi:MAG: ferrous iron transport protein B [Woeseiaceae bacterium]